jgi:serine/threonine-protein kinase
MGQAPKKLEGVLAGSHKVKAQAENYSSAEKQVEVAFQQTTPVAIELGGLPGKILVTSIPEGAEVKIDGEKKGVTTYTGSLPAGKHRVEVSQEGYESAGEEVEVQPNKAISKSYALKKYQGPVQGQEYRPGGKKGGPMVYVTDFKFYIDKYEVTNQDYQQCVSAGVCKDNGKENGFTGPNQPVVEVDQNDARTYCQWAGKRLPKEQEWQEAAQGTDGREYPWGNQTPSCQYAIMDDGGNGCGKNHTWEVGSKPAGASPYGAMDMAGNVWEWVEEEGVVRGGSWFYNAVTLRVSNRFTDYATTRNNFGIGFRCARDGS